MSTDPKHYAPLIVQYLDFETTGIYLLQQGVLSLVDYDRFRKALQSGALTNSDVVDQLLQKILKKPREFYRALQGYVIDKGQDGQPSNKELFDKLPKNFGRGILNKAYAKWRKNPAKNKPLISTITEDPVSSSDADKSYEHRRATYREDSISTDSEGETEDVIFASHPPSRSKSRMGKSTSTHSLQSSSTHPIPIPLAKKRNASMRQSSVSGDDNTDISTGRSPSIASLPVTLGQATLIPQYGSSEEIEDKYTQLLELKHLYKELHMKEKDKNEKKKERIKILEAAIIEKNEKLTKVIEEASSLRNQLEEMKIANEKELNDIRVKLNEEKNSLIAKKEEYQNLIKENEILQSKYEATKKYNHILLDENSRVHSAIQELEGIQEEVSQLKEHIQKTKTCFEQILQEFIQKFQLLKQKVEEIIMLKIKATQDCSALMIKCNELFQAWRKVVNSGEAN